MKNKKYDKVFVFTVALLLLTGLFVFFSASMGLLNREGASFSNILFKQILFGIVQGLILLIITSKIHYKKWKKISLPLFLFSFLLTVLVFEPHLGFGHGGAKRWLDFGFFTFQPSELLKYAFIIYLASWLISRKEDIKSFRFGLLPFLVVSAFVGIVLILQPDIGTLGVIALTSAAMFFMAGGKPAQLAIIIFLGISLVVALAFIKPHAMSRMTVFLNPSADLQGIGYQSHQSLIAIGSGGLFGRGFGMSIQKFNYLPEPVGDSIFAVFAEEFGFVGSLFLISLFLFFLFRGSRIVMQTKDPFARLLGSGIVILIVLQSFINIGAILGILPLTGLPLIFISQGGSALAMALAGIGILLNISKNT
ncbi:MAG: putative lipid II flippase FtsW [Patescibacteria group bacterium]